MSATRDVLVDNKLESHQQDLEPVNASYTQYTYEKVPSSGDIAQWTGGSNLTYSLPEYSNSVWDLNESYLEARVRLEVKYTYNTTGNAPPVGNEGPVSVPPSAYSTAAIEEYFMSSLLEDIQVTYGSSAVAQFDAPNQLFPLLHSVYTLMTNDNEKYLGDALCNNFGYVALNEDGPLLQGTIKNVLSEPRDWSILNDCRHPYNLALSARSEKLSNPVNNSRLPFAYQNSGNSTYRPAQAFHSGWQYRSSLILNDQNFQPPNVGGGANDTFTNDTHNIVMKLKFPFAEDGFKKPANINLRITLRRSKSILYSLVGDSQADAVLAAGNNVVSTAEIVSSTYKLVFEDMNLFAKRLVLSETQRMVLYDSPDMIYDSPMWSAQQFDMTGAAFNKNMSFTSLPQLILVGLVPKNYINPIPITGNIKHFDKYVSYFHTTPKEKRAFSQLYIQSSYGRIPESAYEPTTDAGEVNTAQSQRAYNEFCKSMKLQRVPLGFKNWLNGNTWFSFIMNTSGGNPQYEASRKGRSTINIVAQTVGPDALENNSVVVIGMELNQLMISGLKSVAVTI